MEKSFDSEDDSYESKRIRNTKELWKKRDELQGKSNAPTPFTSDVKLKTRILPRFDQSDSESESDQESESPDKDLPKIVIVDESAQPVADGDKAEQKKEPANNVCFHKFRFSLFSHRSNSIVVAHDCTCWIELIYLIHWSVVFPSIVFDIHTLQSSFLVMLYFSFLTCFILHSCSLIWTASMKHLA